MPNKAELIAYGVKFFFFGIGGFLAYQLVRWLHKIATYKHKAKLYEIKVGEKTIEQINHSLSDDELLAKARNIVGPKRGDNSGSDSSSK